MDENPDPRVRRPEPLSLLWRSLAAPQALIVFLLSVACAVVLTSLVPQIPPQARADPEAWLAVQSGWLGQRNSFPQILQLYDLPHAFWFRFLLALVGLALFVQAVDAAELAWRSGRRAAGVALALQLGSSPGFGRDVLVPLSGEQAWRQILDLLERRGFSLVDVRGELDPPEGRSLLAGRHLALLWARPVAFGALLMALIGLAVSGGLGWVSGDWTPAAGDVQAVGQGTPYAVRLDRFDVGEPDGARAGGVPVSGRRGRPFGEAGGWQVEITWLEGGTEVEQAQAALGRPAQFHGLRLHLIGYVPEVTVRGWDEDGQPVVLQDEGGNVGAAGAVEILFPSTQARPLLFIPGPDLYLALSSQSSCIGGPSALQLTVFRGDGPVGNPPALPAEQAFLARSGEGTDLQGSGGQASATMVESGDVSLAGLRLGVGLAYRPVLRLARQPGLGLALGALALALVALALAWLLPPQAFRVVATPAPESGTLVRVTAGPGVGGSQRLRRFLSDLSTVADDRP